MVAIFTLKGELVALGTAKTDSSQMQKKTAAVKIDRVVIDKTPYKM